MSAVSAAPGRTTAFASRLAPVAGLAVVLAAAAVSTPSLYSGPNLRLVLFLAGLIGVTAIGQTLVLLTGGIDLSVGAVVGLTTVIIATQTDGRDAALPGAIALALVAAVVVGLMNAGLVLLRDVPPFVATFATFVLVQGAITAWTRGAPSGTIPGALRPLGTGKLLGLPTPVWIFAGLAAVTAVVLARTAAGRRLYATGANPRAARLSGIRTGQIVLAAYLLAALLSALGGLINAGYIGYVDAQLSRSLNLDPIAAAVIGGVALTGGQGTIGQTVVGVALLAVLLVWMLQLGAGAGGQLAVEGAAILLAVWLQRRGSSTHNTPQGGR